MTADMNLETALLLAAFILLVLSAARVSSRHIDLFAAGMALFVASLLVPLV